MIYAKLINLYRCYACNDRVSVRYYTGKLVYIQLFLDNYHIFIKYDDDAATYVWDKNIYDKRVAHIPAIALKNIKNINIDKIKMWQTFI
jgi:hypothetical protein